MRKSAFARRQSIATAAIVCAAMTVLPACQQGNAPLGGTPLGGVLGPQFGGTSGTPMGSAFGSGTVTPAGANLGANPFSAGPTRVTPPPTGSIGNAALGTPVPGVTNGVNPYLGAQNTSANGMGPSVANSPRSDNRQTPIGSGLAPAAWTETASNFSTASNFGAPNLPNQVSQFRDPARSGMRVIDMTAVPNPPGYRPTPNASVMARTSHTPNQFGSQRNFGTQPNFNDQPNPMRSPVPPVQIASATPPAFSGSPANASTYNAPASFQQPLPPAPQSLPAPTRDATVQSVPSTEPLQWRRPGTGF